MANKMLIDASHPEETRVVVLRGNRVEEFDFESANKRPLRGNIYLAKVTRVEPSLQAAFVDYGGNRHGFLAFSEIHPDYYQIPVADRQALLEEEARSDRYDEDEPNGERRSRRHRRPRRSDGEPHDDAESALAGSTNLEGDASEEGEAEATPSDVGERGEDAETGGDRPARAAARSDLDGAVSSDENLAPAGALEPSPQPDGAIEAPEGDHPEHEEESDRAEREPEPFEHVAPELSHDPASADPNSHDDDDHEITTLDGGSEHRVAQARTERHDEDVEPVEQIGGDAMEEVPRRPQRLRRQYKIQEVIKRRQVLLIQVVKEERGNKGAALTTYLSLAGRYSVLMPNTARGGGISRKITNAQDRSRLKGIAEELDVPEGMGVILRTAGASRTKAEVKRDFEYLLRMWETVRETTLASSAPTLVYEEGSLIKRAIRDLYGKDVDEVVVAGETGYREARQFMHLLMPSHVNAVQFYRDTQPLFARAGVEAQLDAMFSNQVTLKSGGYLVINQTEALVAIDVNSGRSTREHNIEDTAVRTNIEAADEIARQLRLRDLAGLIVVDFIDMEESRNNRAVERRIKDALKNDRARIQVGRISHFGLLEMSRQRIRTGVLEGSTVVCAHCQGSGVVRSTASIALHVLRILEDALIKNSTHDLIVRTRTAVALYILNQKRANLRDLERRFGVSIAIDADDTLTGANYHAIERGEVSTGVKSADESQPAPQEDFFAIAEPPADEEGPEEAEPTADEAEEAGAGRNGAESDGAAEDGEAGRRRRRRRRRRGGERPFGERISPDAPQPTDDGLAAVVEIEGDLTPVADAGEPVERPATRGRGGRRSRRSRAPGSHVAPSEEDAREPSAPERTAGAEAELAPDSDSSPVAPMSPPAHEPPIAAGEQTMETPEVPQAWRPEPATLSAVRLEPPVPAPDISSAPPAAPETPAEAVEDAAQEAPQAPRPRRSGWWQRAKASIVGD